jgi:hypothetical protein
MIRAEHWTKRSATREQRTSPTGQRKVGVRGEHSTMRSGDAAQGPIRGRERPQRTRGAKHGGADKRSINEDEGRGPAREREWGCGVEASAKSVEDEKWKRSLRAVLLERRNSWKEAQVDSREARGPYVAD